MAVVSVLQPWPLNALAGLGCSVSLCPPVQLGPAWDRCPAQSHLAEKVWSSRAQEFDSRFHHMGFDRRCGAATSAIEGSMAAKGAVTEGEGSREETVDGWDKLESD